jgi:hypothetical protein
MGYDLEDATAQAGSDEALRDIESDLVERVAVAMANCGPYKWKDMNDGMRAIHRVMARNAIAFIEGKS